VAGAKSNSSEHEQQSTHSLVIVVFGLRILHTHIYSHYVQGLTKQGPTQMVNVIKGMRSIA
jgi:hypothetical protein